MKFRADFVTNSSSSSFIGVFAKIRNEKKANKIINDYDLERWIKTGQEIIDQLSGRNWRYFNSEADWAGVNPNIKIKDIDKKSTYLDWGSHGGAGDEDHSFWKEEWGAYDYDVELSDFEDEEQKIYKSITKENGFEKIRNGFGAGRNG